MILTVRQLIKNNARRSLKHHWGRAIGILLFLFGVNALFLLLEQFFCYLLSLNLTEEPALVVDLFHGKIQLSSSMAVVTACFAVVSFVITTPLMFGMTKWYFHQVGGDRPALQTLFTYFYGIRDLFRSIALRFILAVRITFWAALFAVPPAAIFWGAWQMSFWNSSYAALLMAILSVLAGIVAIAMTILWFCWIQRYFLVDYLFVSDSGLGLHAMIRKSVRIMKKNRCQTAALYGSFIPWLLLSVLVAPLLFVLPYMAASTAIHARVLIEQDQRRQSN